MTEEKKVTYYSDLLNDDFSGTNIKTKFLDKDFIYVRKNVFFRFAGFLLYYLFAYPLVSLFCIFYLHLKIRNRKVFKKVRRQGFFLYGNHTGFYDAFTHNVLCFPRRSHVIANRDAVSIKGLKHIVMMLGALPIPNTVKAMMNFIDAVEYRYRQKRCITIYPEAHIWPYYNKIRPFKDTSFHYPVKLNAPSIAMCTVYRHRKNNKRPFATIYLSEPFYPDLTLSKKEAQIDLRNRIFGWMNVIVSDNYEYIRYEYRPKEKTDNS